MTSTSSDITWHSTSQPTTCHVIWCTRKYYSRATLTTKICSSIFQCYSVLQSSAPILRRIANNHFRTTLIYKVLLQYHFVPQNITPVIPFDTSTTLEPLYTTKYYSSTTPYYKGPLLLRSNKYCSCSTPVLLQNYSLLQKNYSSTTPYYKVLLKNYKVLLQNFDLFDPVLLRTQKKTIEILLQY